MRNVIRLAAVVAVLVSIGFAGSGTVSASSKAIIANGDFSVPSNHGTAHSLGIGKFRSCVKHWQLVQTQAGTQVSCDYDSPSTAPDGGRAMVYVQTSETTVVIEGLGSGASFYVDEASATSTS